ncbi:MAG: EpsD family peptidyl-prolyl cis-trans isomerase [Aquabacterium sp.]|uniref:EpsD family peptidyl-prolyl cis-trans isomerase n=1 Tax=Aquabacterium sp. TaxID=1872578 RepID=UPI00271711BF|nr:EpsD family peptidyl-prolyl cis-trans isomerase [Aquabacterium sp.]MDO9002812.1 EpsD family peptidyl-prolyl cis-trans isomerase [Aquabacterium sp.]
MHVFKLGSLSLLVVLLAACGRDHAPADGQVVALVNEDEISVHQVQAVLQRQPALSGQLGQAAGEKVLQGLIEQELAAQAARAQKLDSSPKVLQAMALAKREILAREYQDRLADKAVPPNTGDIDRYYDEHPELFKERRRYTIQETALKVSPAEAPAWRDRVKATTSLAEANEVVSASGLPATSREMVEWAENLPLALLKQFSTLEPGQSLVLERPDGLVIGTLVHTELAPINRRDAAQAIQAVLTNQRRREAVSKGMEALRQGAKIQLLGPFAAGASAPEGASKASTAQ